jgi:hypothetical protein
MEDKEFTVKQSKILETAKMCPEWNRGLRKMFPEAFEKKYKVGDIFQWTDTYYKNNELFFCIVRTSDLRFALAEITGSCDFINMEPGATVKENNLQALISSKHLKYIGNAKDLIKIKGYMD